jgi:hypothetical protein
MITGMIKQLTLTGIAGYMLKRAGYGNSTFWGSNIDFQF